MRFRFGRGEDDAFVDPIEVGIPYVNLDIRQLDCVVDGFVGFDLETCSVERIQSH